jgi:hypothetical protein
LRRFQIAVPPPLTAALLGAGSLLVLAFAPAQYLGRQQDDLMYFLAALALPTGRYELMTAVGHPPLTSTAPGWPLLMAPFGLVTQAPGIFQALAALILAAGPWVLWAWLKRRTDDKTALLAALIFASSPLALSQSGTLMPEAAYLLIFLAALMASENGRRGLAGGLGALLVLIRPAGLSALPSLAVEPALKRRWADVVRVLTPALIAVGLWSAWSLTRSGGVQEAGELTFAYGGGMSPFQVARDNVRFFSASLGGSFLPPRHSDGIAAILLGTALLLAVARGLRRKLREPAAVALLGALAMHSLWTWQYERYLIPLLPVLLWALIEGLGAAAPRVLAALLAAQLGFQTLPRLGRPSPWAEPELSRTYAWLKSRPEPGALASALPVRDGWYAERPCLPFPNDADGTNFAAKLKAARARFILRQDGLDLGLSAGAPLSRLLGRAYGHLDDTRRFRKVHEEPAERASIYEPL